MVATVCFVSFECLGGSNLGVGSYSENHGQRCCNGNLLVVKGTKSNGETNGGIPRMLGMVGRLIFQIDPKGLRREDTNAAPVSSKSLF